MFKRLMITGLLVLPLAAHDHHGHDGWKERRREEKQERKAWKRHEKEERREWERHRFHEREEHFREEHGDWDFEHPRHRHLCPPWASDYWRPSERRYMALVPGDPTRVYVLTDGRWVLRRLARPECHEDIRGAFGLPLAPPPVPLPHVGLDLHVVLFN